MFYTRLWTSPPKTSALQDLHRCRKISCTSMFLGAWVLQSLLIEHQTLIRLHTVYYDGVWWNEKLRRYQQQAMQCNGTDVDRMAAGVPQPVVTSGIDTGKQTSPWPLQRRAPLWCPALRAASCLAPRCPHAAPACSTCSPAVQASTLCSCDSHMLDAVSQKCPGGGGGGGGGASGSVQRGVAVAGELCLQY